MSIQFAREFQICENSCRENQASKSLTLEISQKSLKMTRNKKKKNAFELLEWS